VLADVQVIMAAAECPVSAALNPESGQKSLVELVAREVVLVSYAPKLAAALSGATIRQLAYWRKPGPDGQAVLTPEYSATRPIDYSFRDVIALRTCVRLRQEASLQKIRRALDALRVDLGLRDHLSSYRLVADGSTIYLADPDHAVDLLRQKGNVVIHQFVEVLQPFYVQGRQIPALLE
jgi:DNA-binding transcriptional MerR regulator